jgi:polyhydroxyalkanoate synthesis regulator phasin
MPQRKKAKKAVRGGALQQARKAFARLEREGQKLLGRARTETAKRLTASQRKAIAGLMKQARQLRAEIKRRVQQSGRQLEARGEKILASAERRSAKAISGVIGRLKLPTHGDVQGLQRRITSLEKRVADLATKIETQAQEKTPPPQVEQAF